MFCLKCGRELEDDSVFCVYCGADLGKAANKEAAVQNNAHIPAQGMQPQQYTGMPAQNVQMQQNSSMPVQGMQPYGYETVQPKTTNKALIAIGALIAVLFVLILVFVVVIFLRKDPEQEKVTAQVETEEQTEKAEEKSEVPLAEEKSRENESEGAKTEESPVERPTEVKETEEAAGAAKNGGYWFETTGTPIGELDKDYDIKPAIRDGKTNEAVFQADTTIHMSSFMSDRDDEKGTIQTVIIAQCQANMAALKENFPDEDMYYSYIATPMDMYTGKAYEFLLAEGEYSSSKTHEVTLEVDGKKYDISWHQEIQESDNEKTTMIYVTHPIEYNGVGCLIADYFPDEIKKTQFYNHMDEVGGFSGLTADDYYDYYSTVYAIDCRDN